MLEQLLSVTFIAGFLAAMLRLATPILITALGEMVAERSGVMNLGVEGIMVVGAFAGFAVAFHTGNLWLAFLGGGLAGALLGLVMAVMSIRFYANQIVAGLGIWILCQGLSRFLNRRFFGVVNSPLTVDVLEPISIPLLNRIPILGQTLFNQNLVVYLTILTIPVLAFFFSRTVWGLNVDAVGENPHSADAAGVDVDRTRYVVVVFGGMMAGLGGGLPAPGPIRPLHRRPGRRPGLYGYRRGHFWPLAAGRGLRRGADLWRGPGFAVPFAIFELTPALPVSANDPVCGYPGGSNPFCPGRRRAPGADRSF